jgi:pyruvate dehydrogenase E2 component (dihydrolipoamide acetyltransferase)
MRKVFRLPDVGEGIAEAEIVEYLVEVGQEVKADQPVVRVETDKAVVELPAPVTGTIAEIPHSPGDTVQVGDPLLVIETEAEAEAEPPAKKKAAPSKKEEKEREAAPEKEAPTRKPEKAEPSRPAGEPKRVLATPHTRRLARELGVDITTVEGSGRGGRITDEDVREASSKAAPAAPKAPTAAAIQAPATAGFDFEQYGPTRREPLKGIRKRTAEVMARSVSTIPHVTHFDEADVTEMLQVVEQQRPFAEERKVKLTILSFLTKAAADALKKYPWFNSSLDRSIELQDMRGGTFTISNVGALGGMWATPIIVHPQVAILCSLRAKKKPVVRDDEIVVRTIMPLTVSFDHRVLDGADAARFLSHIVRLLEDPMRMLVDVA